MKFGISVLLVMIDTSVLYIVLLFAFLLLLLLPSMTAIQSVLL